jgi:NAD(P)-dependent dehydrogenase (short-subunit alcohol dehydrogenase family)
MDLELRGCVALVTGGVRGVGTGISRVLADCGATVIACARRPPAEPAADLEFRRCDVRDPDQVAALIAAVVDTHGRLDVLVNNAGGAPYAAAATASPRLHAKVVELNLLAPLLVAQAANAVMQQQDTGGVIVMVSSVSGHRPSPGTAAYGAAKAGLDNLVGSLAVEWAPKVRVNSVVAGMVRTEQAHLHYGDAAGVAAVAATVPLGRLAEPEEIGRCVAFLASPLSSYVTGATLTAHGGGEVPAFLAAARVDEATRRR